MKALITESRLDDLVFKWLDRNVSGLSKVTGTTYNSYYNIDGDIMLLYNLEHKSALVSQERIWEYLEQLFVLDYNEAKKIMKRWIESRFGFKVSVAVPMFD